jgi:hypothetical protein
MPDEPKKPSSSEARDRHEINKEMADREEREKQARDRDRRDEEMRARERRERERFRARERDRDRERESDRDRLRRMEGERERQEPSPYRGPANVKSDLSRLVYASARASTDVFVGITQVFGSLVGNFKDSMLPGGPANQRRRSSDDDRDYGSSSGRRSSRFSDGMDDVRSAVRDTADVVARSGEDFAKYYDNTLYDDEPDQRDTSRHADSPDRSK